MRRRYLPLAWLADRTRVGRGALTLAVCGQELWVGELTGVLWFEQIGGGYAHQSEDPARHRRAACGGSLAAVFG